MTSATRHTHGPAPAHSHSAGLTIWGQSLNATPPPPASPKARPQAQARLHTRSYTPADLDLVQSWAAARGMALPEVLIPRDAYVVEDSRGPLGFAVLYFRIFCPVCSLDHLTLRPGTSSTRALRAWRALEAAAISRVQELRARGEADYRIFQTFTEAPLASITQRLGYTVGTRPHVPIFKFIS